MGLEFNHGDAKEVKQQSVDNFKNIKPEKEMTRRELKDGVKNEFSKASKEKEAENQRQDSKEYFDDNGVKYREGNELLPNNEFHRNEYKYKTDDKGRVISAEGKLQVKNHENRKPYERSTVNNGDKLEKDEAGHLIADQFNGSGGMENLVAMDQKLNRGDYKKLENTLASAVKNGADVYYKVEPKYESNSTRPSEFRVTYNIDGEKSVVVLKNESGGKS